MKLNKYIAEAVRHHDCVVLPGFGALIARRIGATSDFQEDWFYPPGRSVVFNSSILDDDGVLSHFIATRTGQDHAAAKQLVSEEISEWRRRLHEGERMDLPGVGFIYIAVDGKFRFETSRDQALELSSFGLIPVRSLAALETAPVTTPVQQIDSPVQPERPSREPEPLQIIKAATPQATLEAKAVLRSAPMMELDAEHIDRSDLKIKPLPDPVALPELRRRKVRRRIAMAASMLPISLGMWFGLNHGMFGDLNVSVASIMPFDTEASQYQHRNSFLTPALQLGQVDKEFESEVVDLDQTLSSLPENVKVYQWEFSEGFFIPVALHGTPASPMAMPEAPVRSTDNHYHLIGGCFGEKANADLFVKHMKAEGRSAFILDKKGGLHRVSIASFPSKDQALQAKANLKAQGHSTWLLSK